MKLLENHWKISFDSIWLIEDHGKILFSVYCISKHVFLMATRFKVFKCTMSLIRNQFYWKMQNLLYFLFHMKWKHQSGFSYMKLFISICCYSLAFIGNNFLKSFLLLKNCLIHINFDVKKNWITQLEFNINWERLFRFQKYLCLHGRLYNFLQSKLTIQ